MPDSSSNSDSATYDYYDDPLFLSTADQSTASLSTLPFDGHDFMGWKREVLMSLAAKNKVGFIDGTCPRPPTSDKRFNQWLRCDYMILRWISNSLEKSLKENLKYVRSSKELWGELLERFGQANALEVYQLTKELGDVVQDNISLIEYYGKLKNLWETLDCLDPMPVCSCGKIDLCSCTLMKKMVERESNAKLIQFLMNLNHGFKQPNQKRGGQFSQNHGAIVVKHCDQCNRDGYTKETCSGLVKCPHCNKTGHNPDHCFLIREFPGDKKGKSKVSRAKNSQSRKTSNSADVMGFDSPLDDDSLDLAAHSGLNAAGTSSSAVGVLMKISDQQPHLSSANFAGKCPIQSHVFTAHKSEYMLDWIVDTEASDHMTYDLKLLSDIHEFKTPVKVGLPDGSVKLVYKMGTVKLTDDISLVHVFLIPDFKQNLLSVSKMLDDNKLTVMFTAHGCNDSSTSLINLVKLLVVNKVQKHVLPEANKLTDKAIAFSTVSDNIDLIHTRLGHMSFDKIKFATECSVGIKQDLHCHTCVLAKQLNVVVMQLCHQLSQINLVLRPDIDKRHDDLLITTTELVNPATSSLLVRGSQQPESTSAPVFGSIEDVVSQ
ncbi:uncharacterized protein LOC141629323 [Silene latifolia]|uniref:uncharacterized protein LOC141629323 n=1 Tax=Silene latifolia TaxID=37657 RepID=UPI003D770CEB